MQFGYVRLLMLAAGLCMMVPVGCSREPAPEVTPEQSAGSTYPNIVIYLVDTLRPDHLGLNGYERNTSPRLDAFARDSVVFDAAFSVSGWTKPAVASVLSGVNPPRHGAVTRTDALPGGVTVLGEFLSPLGYHTAAVVTNPNIIPYWGFDQGFDEFYSLLEETGRHRADSDTVNEYTFRYLAATTYRPFFLYLHTLDPHSPYSPPAPYNAMFTDDPPEEARPSMVTPELPVEDFEKIVALYDGEIAFNDEQFGLLLDHLKKQGLYDDAMIVFVSDHGEEFLDHGRGGHGHTLYQELVHVPLLIKFPGNRHAGTRVRTRVSVIDIVPTVLAWLKQEVPTELEGRSVVPLVEREHETSNHRPLYFDLDLVRANGGALNISQGILSGPYKYIEVSSPESYRLLFDLESDPDEQRNLLLEHTEVAERLRQQVDTYAADAVAGLHFRVANRFDADRVVSGVLRTDGRFVGLRSVQCEAEDEILTDGSGKKITYRLQLTNQPNPVGAKPSWLVDEDEISFRLEPEDATFYVEPIVVDGGETVPLFVGIEQHPVEEFPASFRGDDPAIAAPNMTSLFRKNGQPRYERSMGGYLIAVRPAERQERDLDTLSPKIRDQLERLGYLDAKEAGDASAGNESTSGGG
jgi:arylsulfatase A-like enzyme